MDNEAEKQFIDHPDMNGFCDKCRNHYLLDGDVANTKRRNKKSFLFTSLKTIDL